jgi:type IV pilus secretin PilQ/predicted competence protein
MKTNRPALRRGYLIFAGTALAVSPVFAQTQAPASVTTAAVISSVAITQAPERSAVRVEGEGRLDVRAARMQSPDRLVLDFAGAKLAVQKTAIPGTSAPVRGVRMAQYRPDVARVVIDLTAATHYQVERDGEAVVIYLDSPSKTVATTNAVLRSSKDSNSSSPRFALPSELTQPSATLASFSEKKEADTITQQAAAQQAVQQASTAATTMAASAATQAPAQAPAAAPVGKYTGEPISVNLKDVDLKDFFRLIHEISGLNVVLDPAVKGTLTIVLDEVPWDQALDIVMQNNGLDKQLNGNVLRIATRATLKTEAETARDLQKAQAEAIAPVTVTRILSYAKAATLAPVLKKFLSTRGDILFDDRSNQIIVRDIPSVIPIIDNLMHQLDRKAQQVEIEARVVSASRSFALDIGTQLGFAGRTTSGRSFAGGDSDVGTSNVQTTPAPFYTSNGTSSLPLNTNLGAVAPTSGLYLGHRSPNFAVDFFITAAEAKGVGKLLSKPKITTQNNEKATVKQGTKIPIQTTINNTISVQYIDAVLKLEVTPQITAEGTVFMDVLVENTQIDTGIPRVSGIPALDTESAETKVTIADGGTVVIGGIIISSQRTDIQQVPLVGSLPIIGNLFKRTSVTTQSQELMFFLTPRIIPG